MNDRAETYGQTLRERLKGAAAALREQAAALDCLADNECNVFVDRRTAGISGRAWDRLVAAGLPVAHHGRRNVARRVDVEAALLEESRRVAPPKPPTERDEIEELLAKAGISIR